MSSGALETLSVSCDRKSPESRHRWLFKYQGVASQAGLGREVGLRRPQEPASCGPAPRGPTLWGRCSMAGPGPEAPVLNPHLLAQPHPSATLDTCGSGLPPPRAQLKILFLGSKFWDEGQPTLM